MSQSEVGSQVIWSYFRQVEIAWREYKVCNGEHTTQSVLILSLSAHGLVNCSYIRSHFVKHIGPRVLW